MRHSWSLTLRRSARILRQSFGTVRSARAQQTGQRPKIGVVYLGPVAMAGPRVEALLNGLRAAGYGGPEQIEIVLRTTDGDPTRITPLVAEVLERDVDVILAQSSGMVQGFR